ncbi:MAG: hypothetical protein JEZ11_02935 [Desulfobacterales bacterium]|nr:hypothetical protein [Desulfobacterales bacterium]
MAPQNGPPNQTVEEDMLFRGVVHLNAVILGLSLGTLLALGIFVATNWLVLKGGDPVGPHLQLLAQYFIGYRVTFTGSFVGLVYGFAIGFGSGWLIGWIYNRIVVKGNKKS